MAQGNDGFRFRRGAIHRAQGFIAPSEDAMAQGNDGFRFVGARFIAPMD